MHNPEWPKHEKIFDICMKNTEKATDLFRTSTWIHLADAVEVGSISPMEAYDTIRLGYVAEILLVRESHYTNNVR